MKKNLSFEDAMARLDAIAETLESGETPLEESLSLFSEGAELLSFCEKSLKEAKNKIEKLFPEEI